MNFLAHAYLSFGHPEILVGNLVSDFVKGAAYKNFPEPIQHGIRLHRRIDAFTDEHPATRTARTLFVPHYRLYSGALVDILYDHYLANDPEHFSEESLYAFTQQVYRTLEQHAPVLPNRFVQ
ncbi:MAG TPA: ACP phosphodiesterase, partial [Chitinophagaceae bacterium]|nr:ACP phosphodiesterase [Chitinophagaceae bacterium]